MVPLIIAVLINDFPQWLCIISFNYFILINYYYYYLIFIIIVYYYYY